MSKMQREYFLREQLKAIQKELGEGDEQEAEIQEFEQRIGEAGMPEEAEKEARRELDRLRKMPSQAAEYSVIKTYLDWMVNLPWSKATPDNLDIAHARQVLDEDHYGLEDIKERILEFLAVRKLRLERKDEASAKDRCTTISAASAKASSSASSALPAPARRRWGARSPAPWAASSSGWRWAASATRPRSAASAAPTSARCRAASSRSCGALETRNPVFMLDEVDKLGRDFRGDPASALLEVLDPEQNVEFRDHYLDVPFDLSQVFFITTANWLDPIPQPLLDRMEVIEL